jgi:SBF-like CPA transporter family (DUF4137)
VFCGSQKNLVTGFRWRTRYSQTPRSGLVVLPLMIFHQLQLLGCATLAQRYARQQPHRVSRPVPGPALTGQLATMRLPVMIIPGNREYRPRALQNRRCRHFGETRPGSCRPGRNSRRIRKCVIMPEPRIVSVRPACDALPIKRESDGTQRFFPDPNDWQ